jgi:hypothetical protein
MERGPNTKLGHGFEDTIKLWESTFGTSYERAGSMYRGSKPVNLPAPRPPAPSESSSDSNYKALENMTIPVSLPWDFKPSDNNQRMFPFLSRRNVLQVDQRFKPL